MDTIERVLRDFRTVAVVGLSRDPSKAARAIPARLQRAGYRIIPVNPQLSEALGEAAFASLREVPFSVEVVLVFRPADEAPGIARDAIAIGAKALWLQQGIISAEARQIAEGAGLLFVEDRCMGVERAVYGVTHG